MNEILAGKKTYIVAAGIVLAGIGAFLTGDATVQEAVNQVLTGLGIGTLRMGVAKGEI